MSKTTYSSKCEILGTLWAFYKETDSDTWSEFFTWADVGLPLAYFVWQDYCTLKPEGESIVDETWTTFCEMISVDPEDEYTDLKSAFEASSNPPLENDEGELLLTKTSAGLGSTSKERSLAAETTPNRFCTSCGAARTSDARFCTECGSAN
jgi:hypothetical protein